MDDLKLIKKHYGEKMMHLCRELFPTLLETPGLLFGLIKDNFAYNKSLYDDLVDQQAEEDFKNFIYSLTHKKEAIEESITKTPFELLDEAGYTLYECKTEEDIQSFRKYYAMGEALCTFRGGRLNKCHVFFAVKKNVDEIKREDFKEPQRQDEYGTSVISIQFTRSKPNTVSIKNRYNHTVNNPDSTFSNNLDNIIPGLTEAFNKTYGFNMERQSENFEMIGYVLANDGKYYKYNCEKDNIYYCPNNVIIKDFEVIELDKSRYLLIDEYVIDFKEKTITRYDKTNWVRVYVYHSDEFINTLNDIEKIEVKVDKETKTKSIIINDDIIIKLDKENRIRSYTNPHITEIGRDFLASQYTVIEEINLPNVEKIGDDFLGRGESIKVINLPNVKEIGDGFMIFARQIEELSLPNVEKIRNGFMCYSTVKKINMPNLQEVGNNFLGENYAIEEIELPELKTIRDAFMYCTPKLKKVSLPKVERIGDLFLANGPILKSIYLPELVELGNNCMLGAHHLEIIDLPKLTFLKGSAFTSSEKPMYIYLPQVGYIGFNVLVGCKTIAKLEAPNLLTIGNNFICGAESVKNVTAPLVKEIGEKSFLEDRNCIKENIDIPEDLYGRGQK